jgi:hypothetical protein
MSRSTIRRSQVKGRGWFAHPARGSLFQLTTTLLAGKCLSPACARLATHSVCEESCRGSPWSMNAAELASTGDTRCWKRSFRLACPYETTSFGERHWRNHVLYSASRKQVTPSVCGNLILVAELTRGASHRSTSVLDSPKTSATISAASSESKFVRGYPSGTSSGSLLRLLAHAAKRPPVRKTDSTDQ